MSTFKLLQLQSRSVFTSYALAYNRKAYKNTFRFKHFVSVLQNTVLFLDTWVWVQLFGAKNYYYHFFKLFFFDVDHC